MAKIQFTKEQIDKFEKKASEFDSEEELLITLKAIRIRDGQRFVMQYEGLKGSIDPVTGAIFVDNHAFTLYQKFIEEIKARDKRKNYAKKMQEQHYEQEVVKQGIDNF